MPGEKKSAFTLLDGIRELTSNNKSLIASIDRSIANNVEWEKVNRSLMATNRDLEASNKRLEEDAKKHQEAYGQLLQRLRNCEAANERLEATVDACLAASEKHLAAWTAYRGSNRRRRTIDV